ncbi:MAG TPA: VWA domain-containing protein [Granulicella sp.]|nr:VWA domain-containing protein [Granulicella sp.]
MPLRSLVAVLGICWMYAAAVKPLDGQSKGSTAEQGFTLRSETRSVLTDVTVIDRNGNPVRGLPSSVFHIFDDNRPQDIASFEEHSARDTGAAASAPAGAAGVYSNDLVLHPPSVLNIVLLDTTNIDVEDQMYLSFQLNKFLKTLEPGQQLAVYLRNGPAIVQLQGFTADHELLAAAIHRGLPRFLPQGREYLTDAQTLHELAVHLGQWPGRKNVLWFSGGSTAFLMADAEALSIFNMAGPNPDLRPMYDELESSRIAVYPIDARGLTLDHGAGMLGQQMMMSEEAEATGGQAFYANNGLAQIARKVTETDGSFYSLTYSPHDFHYDNKWHKVRVTVAGNGYRLSYRHGYFADASNGSDVPSGTRNRLLPDGTTAMREEERTVPIVFEASVAPRAVRPISGMATPEPAAPPKRGTMPLTIHYSVPADSLARRILDGQPKVLLGIAVLAFDENGGLIGHDAEQFTLRLNEEKLRLTPHAPVLLQQQIDLRKGEAYLYVTMWDMTSGHAGSIEMPVHVPMPVNKTDAAIVH